MAVNNMYKGFNNHFQGRLLNHPTLSREDELELIKKAKSGDNKALNDLILYNQRSIFALACKYATNKCPCEDLMQEGILGLVKAIENWDFTKQVRLNTYSYWWIEQKMRRMQHRYNKIISIPYYHKEATRKIVSFIASYKRLQNRNPTAEEISKQIDIPEYTVKTLLASMGISVVYFDDHKNRSNRKISKYNEEQTKTSDSPDYKIIEEEKNEVLRQILLDTLTKREYIVMVRRFGLFNTNKAKSMNEIAKEFNISRERVRQIINESLGKLRKKANLQQLEGLL